MCNFAPCKERATPQSHKTWILEEKAQRVKEKKQKTGDTMHAFPAGKSQQGTIDSP